MRPALKRNDEVLSQLSFGTKKCIWPKGGLRNTFYLFILRLLIVSEKNVRWSDPSCYLTGNGTSGGWDGSEDKWDKARTPTRNSITYFS